MMIAVSRIDVTSAKKMGGRQTNKLAAIAIMFGLSVSGAPASGQTVFSEDFSGATPGTYNGAVIGSKFTVSNPGNTGLNVDIVGVLNGNFFNCVANPGGNCLDLVGNSGPGAMITSTTFNLAAGTTYTLALTDILQGFPSGDPATAIYTASIDGFSQTFTATADAARRMFSFTPLAVTNSATLIFTDLTSPDSVHGPILSDIAITGAPSTGAVPEPASWAMITLGMGAVGLAMRRRQKTSTMVSYA